ncbi:unnamed protein product [Mytilus coruscus]|uniref:Uncharacterized protein n=1 Tax=Mytilus coruscus TaxID=42192 RepID=A0A6J8AE58_MYTCO|nr:unnamed protein product [Mytilus coruscus]
MGMPTFQNLNSSESLAMILRHIGMQAGIKRYGKDNDRDWTFVCCDGRPHSLFQKILNEAVICTHCLSNKTCSDKAYFTKEVYMQQHKRQHSDLPKANLEKKIAEIKRQETAAQNAKEIFHNCMQGNASVCTGTSTNNNNRMLDSNQHTNISVARITCC